MKRTASAMATQEWIEISTPSSKEETSLSKPLKLRNFLPMTFRVYAADKTTILFELPSEGELRLKSGEQHPIKGRAGSVACDDKLEIVVPVIAAQNFIAIDEKSPGYKAFESVAPTDAVLVSLPCAKFLAQSAAYPNLSSIYCSASGPNEVVRNDKRDVVGTTSLEYHARRSIQL
jgi:hypothetical protein